MPVCAVITCRNKSCTRNLTRGGVSYHRFPRNPNVHEKWISATGRNPNWIPSKVATICSDHFEPHHFVLKTGERRYLHSLAVPSRNIKQCQPGGEQPPQQATVPTSPAVKPPSSTSYIRVCPLQQTRLSQGTPPNPISIISPLATGATANSGINPLENINGITSIEVEIMPENKVILYPRNNTLTTPDVNMNSQRYEDDLGVIEVMRAKIEEQDILIRKLKVRNYRLKKRLFSLKSMEAMEN